MDNLLTTRDGSGMSSPIMTRQAGKSFVTSAHLGKPAALAAGGAVRSGRFEQVGTPREEIRGIGDMLGNRP